MRTFAATRAVSAGYAGLLLLACGRPRADSDADAAPTVLPRPRAYHAVASQSAPHAVADGGASGATADGGASGAAADGGASGATADGGASDATADGGASGATADGGASGAAADGGASDASTPWRDTDLSGFYAASEGMLYVLQTGESVRGAFVCGWREGRGSTESAFIICYYDFWGVHADLGRGFHLHTHGENGREFGAELHVTERYGAPEIEFVSHGPNRCAGLVWNCSTTFPLEERHPARQNCSLRKPGAVLFDMFGQRRLGIAAASGPVTGLLEPSPIDIRGNELRLVRIPASPPVMGWVNTLDLLCPPASQP